MEEKELYNIYNMNMKHVFSRGSTDQRGTACCLVGKVTEPQYLETISIDPEISL